MKSVFSVFCVLVLLSKTKTFLTDSDHIRNQPLYVYRNVSQLNMNTKSTVSSVYIDTNEVAVNISELPWWEGGPCNTVINTKSKENVLNVRNLRGYCGYRASNLGEGQKVISFSLFGNYTDYALGLPHILESVQQLYPGWIVRLYTEPRPYKLELCSLLKRHLHLHICDVTNLPEGLRNLSDVQPRLWRVAPLGDPLVDVFLSRDIDSEVIPREAEAVADFLEKGETLHIMRDNPEHGVPILAGTFGVRQTVSNQTLLNTIRDTIFQKRFQKYPDQTILANFLYPQLRGSMVAHDSFTCLKFPGSSSFPTQRRDGQFVGNRKYRPIYRNDSVRKPCPRECRPRGQRDWLYC